MWHDTMLAGCKPVLDSSHCCIAAKAHPPGSLKLSCCFVSKLKVERGVVHGGSSSSGWRNAGRGQPNGREGSSLVWKSRIGRSPYLWQSVSVSIRDRGSRPVVTVLGSASSLAVTMTAVVTKDTDISGLTNGEAGMQVYNNPALREPETNVAESEKLRRHRISIANKGKVPWNKGGKHSAETIKRIKEKTSLAMQTPQLVLKDVLKLIFVLGMGVCGQVMAKLKLNARHPQTDETKEKIRGKLRDRWATKKQVRGYQDMLTKEWKNCVAEAARMGGLGEEELQWNSYTILKKKLRLAAVAQTRLEKKEAKAKLEATRPLKSKEHRLRISAAIRAKWEDPEYKFKVKQGMVKSGVAVKKKRAQRRKPSGDNVTSEAGCFKKPLDHGFVTAVMSGEKKRRRKVDTVEEQTGKTLEGAAEKITSRVRDRKVDLLKIFTEPTQSEQVDSTEDDFTEELSVSAQHSFVDPDAGEKLYRLKLLQASRSVMDQRRREATHRAKVLMAEAEQAAKNLEAAAGNDEFALSSLAEIYRLMAEAEQFIQAADSLHKDVESTKPHSGALWKSTMAPYKSSKFKQLITDGSTEGQDDGNSDEIHGHNPSLHSGHDIAEDKTVGPISGSEQVMMFGNDMRDKPFLDMHNPFTDELRCNSRFSSTVTLLNGSSSRRMGAMKGTEYGSL